MSTDLCKFCIVFLPCLWCTCLFIAIKTLTCLRHASLTLPYLIVAFSNATSTFPICTTPMTWENRWKSWPPSRRVIHSFYSFPFTPIESDTGLCDHSKYRVARGILMGLSPFYIFCKRNCVLVIACYIRIIVWDSFKKYWDWRLKVVNCTNWHHRFSINNVSI